ncbi:IclR family transcriptional regulator domain-containing protein [Streptomyces sp. NPDC055078]
MATTSRVAGAVTAPAEAVGPLMRGIAVLGQISAAGGRMAVSDLVRSTGLARSTVDRIIATLARMDYLRLDGHAAVLAPRLMELGNAYLAAVRLPGPLGPLAEKLAGELDESVSLAVPDRDGIRFVHQTSRRRAMSLTFRTGDLLPAERTAQGAVFAAHWDEPEWTRWREQHAADPHGQRFPALPPPPGTPAPPAAFEQRAAAARTQGWAIDDQLIEPGLIALALPVHGPDGHVVCALALVSHTSRHSAHTLRQALLPRTRDAVAAMEQRLRTNHHPAEQQPPAGGLADWTNTSKHELGAEFVESLARGLTVLTAFGDGRAELTLAAVAEATGLARATARRALITLEHLGHVETRNRHFRLTPRVLALGYPPLSRTTLSDIAAPHLTALVQQVNDSASLAVLDGDAIQYTARVATGRIMSVDIRTGTRLPAHATSMGRVLLAGLPTKERTARLERTVLRALTPRTITALPELTTLLTHIAHNGYALVDGELEEGLRSLAVPVHDRDGRVVAAVNVAMHHTRRTTEQCLTEVLPELRATAHRIEADLRIAGRFTRIPPT